MFHVVCGFQVVGVAKQCGETDDKICNGSIVDCTDENNFHSIVKPGNQVSLKELDIDSFKSNLKQYPRGSVQ